MKKIFFISLISFFLLTKISSQTTIYYRNIFDNKSTGLFTRPSGNIILFGGSPAPFYGESTYVHFQLPEKYLFPLPGENHFYFHNLDYTIPSASVFCRMENFTQKNLDVMFSIHAGGFGTQFVPGTGYRFVHPISFINY